MPNPTIQSVHVNRPLTNISVAYIQNAMNFAAGRVFPMVPVESKSDDYFIFNNADFNRDDLKPRASGAESAGTGFRLDTETYNCKRHDLHHDIADDVRANTDAPINMDSSVTQMLTGKALIRREMNFAQSFMAQGVWSTELQGVAATPGANEFIQWDQDSSDPVEVVESIRLRVLLATGFELNKMTISYDVLSKLKTNPSVIDRIKYSGGISNDTPVNVTENALRDIFGVQDLIVSKAVVETAKEGGTSAREFIVEKSVLLSYSPPTPSLMEPSAGYIFSWRGLMGNNEGTRVKRFRMENLESDRVEVQTSWDMKKVSEAAGFLYDVIA